MNNLGYLFIAYVLIFLVIFLYVFNLSRKQKQLFREIESMKEAIKDHPK
ncbi:MAG: CcmD family protein [Candidatus Aminicenantales bacterium]